MRRARIAAIVAFACGVTMVVPPVAFASCQTLFCHYERTQEGLRRLAELQREIERDGGSDARWEDLLGQLQSTAAARLFVAEYDAMFRWEPQAALERDLVAESRKERLAWLAAWEAAAPEAAGPKCLAAREDPDQLAPKLTEVR